MAKIACEAGTDWVVLWCLEKPESLLFVQSPQGAESFPGQDDRIVGSYTAITLAWAISIITLGMAKFRIDALLGGAD